MVRVDSKERMYVRSRMITLTPTLSHKGRGGNAERMYAGEVRTVHPHPPPPTREREQVAPERSPRSLHFFPHLTLSHKGEGTKEKKLNG